MFSRKRTSTVFLGVLLSLLIVLIACGEEATPAPAPTAAPGAGAISAADIAAQVQSAVEAAIASRPAPAEGLSPEDIPSVEDISALVQASIAAVAPEGTSPEQLQQMVQAAVAAAASPGVTSADLQSVVAAAVAAAVSEAVSQVTPGPGATPAATPALTPTAPAIVEPTGTLNVGVADLGVPIFVMKNQPFRTSQINAVTTFEAMYAMNDDGITVNRLVEDWNIDPTGLIYTFNLREGIPWIAEADYGNFDADDFLFSIGSSAGEGSIHSAGGNVRRTWLCDECQLTKLDNLTVQLTRSTPTFEITWHSRQASLATMTMHSAEQFEALGEEAANGQAVGTGPWQVVGAKTGVNRVLRAVRNHWRKTPEFDEMVWLEIQEESTRFANFLTGLLDTGQFAANTIQDIKSENLPGVQFMSFPGALEFRIQLNGQQYAPDSPFHGTTRPLGEGASYLERCGELQWVSCNRIESSEEWQQALKVRLAMAISVDRQKLVNNLALGDGEPASYTLWAGLHKGRLKQFSLDQFTYEYDPERAKTLLAEAGYPDGLDVSLVLTSGTAPGSIEMGQAVATMWESVGIRATQKTLPYSNYRPSLVSRTAKELHAYATPPGIPEPIRLYNLFWGSGSGFNFGFEHPTFETLRGEANAILDEEERWAKQAEIAKWVFDNVMIIPLYTASTVWPIGPKIDRWELLGLHKDVLSNWEFVPHAR